MKKKNLFIWVLIVLMGIQFGYGDSVENNFGVITGNNVRVRDEANTKARIVLELFKGNSVKILEEVKGEKVSQSDKWYKVSGVFLYNQEGFVHSSFVVRGQEAIKYLKNLDKKTFEPQLKTLFSSKEIQLIDDFRNDFERIKTGADFEKVYKNALKNLEALSKKLDILYQKKQAENNNNPYQINVSWLYNFLPGHIHILVAEGTIAEFTLLLSDFLKKAKQINDKASIGFIELMIEVYGEIKYHYPVWFAMKWDYGGDSLLGTGIHYKLMKKIDGMLKKSNLFHSELKQMKEAMIQDIMTSINYSEPVDVIIKELKEIIESIQLSKEQKAELMKRLNIFQNSPQELNTNCKDSEKSKCTYG